MRRQDKYPETSTFHFYNANPHNRITDDCVTRAMTVALNIPYNQVVMEQAQMQIDYGYDNADTKGISKYMELKKWIKFPQPKHFDNTKYTLKEFCEQIAKPNERYIVTIAGHCVAVVDKKVWDIWDCTKFGKCVCNYWREA